MTRQRAIEVYQYALEWTRTPSQACRYRAETWIDHEYFSAVSRHGATMALARVVMAAGIPDAPLIIRQGTLRGHMTVRSFYDWAQWTIHEGDKGGPYRVRWVPVEKRFKIRFWHSTYRAKTARRHGGRVEDMPRRDHPHKWIGGDAGSTPRRVRVFVLDQWFEFDPADIEDVNLPESVTLYARGGLAEKLARWRLEDLRGNRYLDQRRREKVLAPLIVAPPAPVVCRTARAVIRQSETGEARGPPPRIGTARRGLSPPQRTVSLGNCEAQAQARAPPHHHSPRNSGFLQPRMFAARSDVSPCGARAPPKRLPKGPGRPIGQSGNETADPAPSQARHPLNAPTGIIGCRKLI